MQDDLFATERRKCRLHWIPQTILATQVGSKALADQTRRVSCKATIAGNLTITSLNNSQNQ